jgi:CDP-glucose 4,6-dehydratase
MIQTSRTLVCITTDKVYQNNEWYWGYRETDTLGGNDPYSASKASCELLINSYTRSFFSDSTKTVASVRAGNVIGGGDWADYRIVPDFFRSLENGEELILRNPGAVRPWQFVLEPLYGYLTLAKKLFTEGGQFQGGWNFGPERDKFVDVENLIKTLIQVNNQGSYSIV